MSEDSYDAYDTYDNYYDIYIDLLDVDFGAFKEPMWDYMDIPLSLRYKCGLEYYTTYEEDDIYLQRPTYMLNPYIIAHYMNMVYVRYELKYTMSIENKYKTLLRATYNRTAVDEILVKILPRDLINMVHIYGVPSFKEFKEKMQLHFDLDFVFNDNAFVSGGIFRYTHAYSVRPIDRAAVVGPLPAVRSSRRSRVAYVWHDYCSQYLHRTPLFWDTYGFEEPNGFYECPIDLRIIIDNNYLEESSE